MNASLSSPSVLRAVMRRHGFTIRKALGQNFLTDSGVLHDIVEAARAGLKPGDPSGAIEVGPGLGTLTQALAEGGFTRVAAVEKDPRLIPVLRDTLGEYGAVEVVCADALRMDWDGLLDSFPSGTPVRFVANLPYYITTPLVMRVLEMSGRIDLAVVMVQREVAERMAADSGKEYGALSVAVQYYSQPDILRTVSPDCFYPVPEVESAVIALRPRRLFAHSPEQTERFFRIVRAAFAHRRKTLANSLAAEFPGVPKEAAVRWLGRMGIDAGRRGETLSLYDFARLTEDAPEVFGPAALRPAPQRGNSRQDGERP